MHIENITLCLADREVSMEQRGGSWHYEDVAVSPEENGTVSVCARHTPIKMVRISFENTPPF